MDVFDLAAGAGGQFLRDAAIDAGFELGVLAAVADGARTLDELAVATGVPRVHRLRALLDVLVALGAVTRDGDSDRYAAGTVGARPAVARTGWGRIAEVLRTDRPLAIERGEALRKVHDHLATAGAAAARELATLVAGDAFLDLGGGAGAYTAAFLDAHPAARATLVDADDVLPLARDALARFGDRVTFVAGDALTLSLSATHDVVLLANVLHFYAPDDAARLCAIAAGAARPGGTVVIKDLRVDDDREGPLAGLLFALNMAIYTDAGDVHPTSRLQGMLTAAGLTDLTEHRLASSPDAIVMTGRRPSVEAELDAALARTDATLAFPAALRRQLARAIAFEREAGGDGAASLVRHYTETMPRMRIDQLADQSSIFHAPLDWARLPRLSGAIDRLFAIVTSAGADVMPALGFASSAAFRAASPTLAALYTRTHYGGLMPLLYGYPADLAYFERRRVERGLDRLAMIDRYLTAPVVHELCHFARDRDAIDPPHLDECIGGWLGVHVLPSFAYPEPGEDDAIYASPWLAQVGQAIARAFGVDAVVRAHAGAVPWPDALPRDFLDAAAALGWADWRARRTLHLLSDTFDPAPWVALALARPLPPDPGFDRAIVADGLRAMCLDNARVDGSYRARTRVPDAPIEIDAVAGRITTARRGDVDTVAPTYWLPPAVAARLRAAGRARFALTLAGVDEIPDDAAAICA